MNRHFLFSALFTFFSIFCFGQGYQVQSKYFVYLQTEPAQPFYIKINNQQISANASGYLILPQLKDGDYKLVVGFPDGKVSEQSFNFRIDSKDKGYLIKDYGADGWGLFDLQTMVVQKATKPGAEVVAVKTPPPAEKKPEEPKTVAVAPVAETQPQPEPQKETEPADNVSDFTRILSQAANDPSLLEKPKPEPVEEKPVVVEQPKVDPAPQQPVETVVNNPKPTNTSKDSKGVTLVYDDRNESGQVDPITIFIPAPTASVTKTETVVKETAKPVEQPKPVEAKQEENSFKVEEKAPVVESTIPVESETVVTKVSNVACKAVAEEDDFLKLRRTMASEANDDNMIAQAEKAFKTKCYTTAQVKYLSGMFLSNAGKFNFYKAAYGHVADLENFASLESEIKDQAYKAKFNSLLGQ